MKPESKSSNLLGVTRARAKMHEYNVPEELFNSISTDPQELLFLTVHILGTVNDDHQGSRYEARANMLFAAQYFDAYVSSRLEESINSYMLLLGSAAYYLCDLPGSSLVLANKLYSEMPDLEGGGLEFFLRDLLTMQVAANHSATNVLSDRSREIRAAYINWQDDGIQEDGLFAIVDLTKSQIYYGGSDRELLLIDTISKVIRKQIKNSARNRLPELTGVDFSEWETVIKKASFIKEFWPSQILLGEKGVYRGFSAVVQMPTSAGKTKSIEIIIRSSLLSSRSKLVVIVAPFRSLCNEIKLTLQAAFEGEDIEINVPSDAMQLDFDEDEMIDAGPVVLILTPEKLIYMMRHSPALIDRIGLLIYDEGHQFDNGIRGVTYELLLASLRQQIPANAQVILISAVISNAHQVGEWLIGDKIVVVDGVTLVPTYRTIGFVSWRDMQGRIEFVKAEEPDIDEFYVPRVLQSRELQRKKGESKTKKKYFPEKNNGKLIAVFLGLKLVKNGMVAIFCGSKTTVTGIAKSIKDIYERSYETSWPSEVSDQDEQNSLYYLHQRHFGESYVMTHNCRLGVFAHTSVTPQGIRHAIEYAAQNSLVKFIICTSTLAQGVNLPIKYLMVTSFYQASEKIKTRDFHNLIGRAGRAGLHTEGSILFTDPDIYDEKQYQENDYKWKLAKQLLDPSQSEPCSSTIMTIFAKLSSVDQKYEITVSPIAIVQAYIDKPTSVAEIIDEILLHHSDKNFTRASLTSQFNHKIGIIAAIESFLMSHWESNDLENNANGARALAESTLAFATSTNEQREKLIELFEILATNVKQKIADPAKKRAYGKTLFGVQDILDIEVWVDGHVEDLSEIPTISELFKVIWGLFEIKLKSEKLNNLLPTITHFALVENWIQGLTYQVINASLPEDAYRKWGQRKAKIEIDFIVEILEKALAFDSTLLIAAVVEILKQNHQSADELISHLETLQKMLKYGLPSALAIAFYEIGFCDRIIAQELAAAFPEFSTYKPHLAEEIRQRKAEITPLIKPYPAYFKFILSTI